jgi:predicted alpha/beta-hydrolase family hydrolase
MQTLETRFVATPEKGEVSAILVRPQNAKALLVLGHGAGAGMRHRHLDAIAQALAEVDIATFRYHFPYMEKGGGRGSQKVDLPTIRSAVQAARELAPDLPLFAGGHSYGGRMTYLAAAESPLPEVKGLIFFSFPLHAPGKPGVERAAGLKDVTVPMLFLSGNRDIFAKPELLEPLLNELELASLHWLETGNHGYKILKRSRQNPMDIYEEAAEVANRWINAL